MPFNPPCKLKLEKCALDRGGRHVALANQFVNTCWRCSQQFHNPVIP